MNALVKNEMEAFLSAYWENWRIVERRAEEERNALMKSFRALVLGQNRREE